MHNSIDVFIIYNVSKLMKARLHWHLMKHTKECHLAHIIVVRGFCNSVSDVFCLLFPENSLSSESVF